MSVKRLVLAAAVAIFGFSLAGCVDGGPYYGDYTYSGYSPGYYGGPGYYGDAIYGGYYTSYRRPGYRGHHHRYRGSRHYRQSDNRGGHSYHNRDHAGRNVRGHSSGRITIRNSYSGRNSQASDRNSYRGGRQGSHRGNNQLP